MTNLSSPSIPAAPKMFHHWWSRESLLGIQVRHKLDDRRIKVQFPAMATDIYLLQNVQNSDSMVTGLFFPPKAASEHSRSSSDGIKNVYSCTSNPVYTFLQCTRKASLYALPFKINIRILLGYRRMRLKVFLR